jgi:hypothetical protein
MNAEKEFKWERIQKMFDEFYLTYMSIEKIMERLIWEKKLQLSKHKKVIENSAVVLISIGIFYQKKSIYHSKKWFQITFKKVTVLVNED